MLYSFYGVSIMNDAIVRVDLHGKNQYQARIALDSALRRADSGVYRIRVIHGYNSGTVLKNMVMTEYKNHPKVKRIVGGTNLGETDLILREL